MKSACALLLALTVTGCFGGAGNPKLEPVDERVVLDFAERIGAFYALIENIRLDSIDMFEDRDFRGFFVTDREFSDYYASLASGLRESSFRDSRAERVLVHEFRFPREDLALVELILVGRHVRGLRFWEIQVPRIDTWRRENGLWYLTPEKL